jgi:15-cis-phytoene synthase
MSKPAIEQTIFKNGSSTFYWASKLFPKRLRTDVFKLYSFVRITDDYVDCLPQETAKFRALRAMWDAAKNDPNFDTTPAADDSVDTHVIKNIVLLTRTYSFDSQWVEDFLDAMQADLNGKTYRTLQDTLWYVHGSAEVVGLMMARLMGLPDEALPAASAQGRALQWINFIRDIAEDNFLGRSYFPQQELQKFGLENLSAAHVRQHPEAFQKFVQFQLARQAAWQAEAEEGYIFIPQRSRIPLRAAAQTYAWTGEQIRHDPLRVFVAKIKPSKKQTVHQLIKSLRAKTPQGY